MNKASITCIYSYIPEYILNNEELSDMLDISIEWIIRNTGIKERRLLKGNKSTSYMAIRSVEGLLKKSNVDPKIIDLIICATMTPDMSFPSTASIICNSIGATNAACYDINSASTGFICGLSNAKQYINNGTYNKIIVVGVDMMSSITDYQNKSIATLYGDAAACVLIENSNYGLELIDIIMKSGKNSINDFYRKIGGLSNKITIESIINKEHYIEHNSSKIFRYMIRYIIYVIKILIYNNNLNINEINWIVPHQASKKIIELISHNLQFNIDKIMINVDYYGNTSSASIPLCLWSYEKQIKKSDNIILSTFSSGFCWGGAYIKMNL